MPKKKQFYIKGKDEIKDTDAPVVSNEFISKEADGDYHGQTIEVKSDTKLEQDLGTGEAIILRTYEFGANYEMFKNGTPNAQEIFNSHMKGILSMLWGDGLSPADEVQPRLIFSRDMKKYMIMVAARPSIGQTLVDKTKTLTEIIHGPEQNRDSV